MNVGNNQQNKYFIRDLLPVDVEEKQGDETCKSSGAGLKNNISSN